MARSAERTGLQTSLPLAAASEVKAVKGDRCDRGSALVVYGTLKTFVPLTGREGPRRRHFQNFVEVVGVVGETAIKLKALQTPAYGSENVSASFGNCRNCP